jgi:16S rRNA (cytosine967-C5)-methyltransferase
MRDATPGKHKKFRPTRRSDHSKKRTEAPPLPEMKLFSDARVLCALVLYQVYVQQKSLNTLLPEASRYVREQDRALLQELSFGVCRWFYWLKSLYQPLLSKPLHRNDFLAECLLCVGIYQLIFTRIPSHACLNETVEAAEKLNLARFKGLINALLRQITQTDYPLQDPALQASMARLSHPQWFQDKLSHNWPDRWQAIMQDNNSHPPMSLRINRAFEDYADIADETAIQQAYLDKLNAQGIAASASKISPLGIVLQHACAVEALPDFLQGGVSIQDEAAQLSSHLLQLSPGLRVLDACAAPGGKTCAMLEQQDLTMIALDADATRAKRIQENLSRLRLKADVKIARAEELDVWWDGQAFDRILLDAPCSATGVIRRHPDIKLLRQETDILALAEIQLSLLNALWPALKPGGILLYATCSVFSQENSRIIERFLKQQNDAQLSTIDADWGLDTGYGRQMFPTFASHDGFFYARLRKSSQQNQHETASTEKV